MRKGDLGVESLNERLQAVFNPPDAAKAQCKSAGIVLREGDKVMQIKNNYTLEWQRLTSQATAQLGEGVYNGDMGFITRIDNDARLLCVHFDDQRLAEYDFNQLDELALAYAISIHKSQGSEFPVVVLPLLAGPPMLLSRNLLYTAITRARELVVITGREACIAEMVANNRTRRRYGGLGWAFAALAAAGGTRQ